MIQQREAIKANTNKVNCFVDQHEPEFINTMTRTMDAYNTKVSTFGGSHTKNRVKMDKFMQEKGAFIRTSNMYNHNDPNKIADEY